MTDAATTTVTFRVTGIERVHCAGRLVGLAEVEIEVEGVVLVMRGVRLVRQRHRLTAQAPRFRDPSTGTWRPALLLPGELEHAIARELSQVLATLPAAGP